MINIYFKYQFKIYWRKLKEIIFATHWLVPASTICYYFSPAEFEGGLQIVAMGFAFSYFIQKKRLDELKFAMDAFQKFNERYDKLNEPLRRILENKPLGHTPDGKPIDPKDVAIDYFNLCAEEYLLFSEGYIPSKIWSSWSKGMCVIFSNPDIQRYWNEEKSANFQDSYYGFNPKLLLYLCTSPSQFK